MRNYKRIRTGLLWGQQSRFSILANLILAKFDSHPCHLKWTARKGNLLNEVSTWDAFPLMTPPEVPGIAETVRGCEDVTCASEAAPEAEGLVRWGLGESIFDVYDAINKPDRKPKPLLRYILKGLVGTALVDLLLYLGARSILQKYLRVIIFVIFQLFKKSWLFYKVTDRQCD